MFRFLLYLLILYFGFQIIKILFHTKKRSNHSDEIIPPFKNVEEAEFEDITHQAPPPENSEQKKAD